MLSTVENPIFIENTSTSDKIEMAFLCSFRDWAKSLENRRKHYKILKQDFIVLFSLIN